MIVRQLNIKIIHEKLSAADIDNIVSHLAQAADEENLLWKSELYPCGYFYGTDKILRETLKPVLQKFLSETKLCVRHVDGSVEDLDAVGYFAELWDYLFGNENAYCKAADLIAKSLELFIDRGAWQCDLISTAAEEKIHPVVWFVLPNEKPLSYWSLDPCAVNSVKQWLEEMDWSNVLSDDNYVSYWAVECGIDLPDRSKLLNSCPIKIRDGMTTEDLRRAVESLYNQLRQ